MADLVGAIWRKSTYSAVNGCVEVAFVRSRRCETDGCVEDAFVDGLVAVRDSKDRHRPRADLHGRGVASIPRRSPRRTVRPALTTLPVRMEEATPCLSRTASRTQDGGTTAVLVQHGLGGPRARIDRPPADAGGWGRIRSGRGR